MKTTRDDKELNKVEKRDESSLLEEKKSKSMILLKKAQTSLVVRQKSSFLSSLTVSLAPTKERVSSHQTKVNEARKKRRRRT